MITKVSAYIRLIRPYQWIKNLLLFTPLFFSGNISGALFLTAILAILAFCATSSLGYIVNDWADRKKDIHNPSKQNRPLCNGDVSGNEAVLLAFSILIMLCLFIFSVSFSHSFLYLLLLYLFLTLSYSFYLKNIVILEIFAVSMGFVLRVLAGGAVCSIKVSSWLFMTVFFISMLISVAKRLSEFKNLGKEKAILHRKSQNGYTISYLTNMLWACGGVTLVVYALYVVEHGGIVIFSVLPATYGIFRFIYLADLGMADDPIKVLFTDIQLLLTTFFFLTFIGITIYYPI